jgi:hypothetical protein
VLIFGCNLLSGRLIKKTGFREERVGFSLGTGIKNSSLIKGTNNFTKY